METISSEIWLLLCTAALIAGFIDAVAGGGGLLTIPALLTAGLPPHITLGTNKLAATFGSFTASLTFYKKRLFYPEHWLPSMLFTALGAGLGTLLVYHLDASLLQKALPVIVLFTAIYSFLTPMKHSLRRPNSATGASNKTKAIQGAIIGFYDGAAGPGTGAFWTLSNIKLHKLDLLLASGLARTMNFISNGVSLSLFLYLGQVQWVVGLSMGLCIMAGAYLGAHSAIRYGSRFIRPVFLTIVSIMAIKLCVEAWV